jgi:hypothetical protein
MITFDSIYVFTRCVMKKREIEYHQKFEQIFASDQPEIEKLVSGFLFVVERHLTDSEREMELHRAIGDRGELVKEQIKHSTIQYAAEIFRDCYYRATRTQWKPKEDQNG